MSEIIKPIPHTDDALLKEFVSEDIRVVPKLAKKVALRAVTDVEGQIFINMIGEKYKGVIAESSHWSLALVALLHKINYVASRKHCRGSNTLPALMNSIPQISLVQKHLTTVMLDDIAKKIAVWAEESPLALTMTDGAGQPVEGAIILNEGETLSYSTGKVAVDHGAASVTKDDWGSW